MNNPQSPNAGPPPQGSRRFTPGEKTFHILVVILLMVSSAIAFKMSTISHIKAAITGSIATSISVFLVAYISGTLIHTLINNAASEFVSHKIDVFYMMLGNTSQETRNFIATCFVCIYLLSIFVPIFNSLDFTHEIIQTRCNSSLNLLVKHTSETTGLSTGCIVFDTQRADGNLKTQAAEIAQKGRYTKWHQGS